MGIDQYNRIGGVETSINSRFTPWMGLSDTIKRTEVRLTDAHEAHRLAQIDWQVGEILLSDIIPNRLSPMTRRLDPSADRWRG